MVHGGCVFVAGIPPSRTWTSGSFVSMQWNACVHRQDLSLYSHLKEFLENGVRTHVNSKGKIPSTGKNSSQRGIEPTTLHKAGQQAQYTTNKLFPPQTCLWYMTQANSINQKWTPLKLPQLEKSTFNPCMQPLDMFLLLLLLRSQLYLWGSSYFFFFFCIPSYISGYMIHDTSK